MLRKTLLVSLVVFALTSLAFGQEPAVEGTTAEPCTTCLPDGHAAIPQSLVNAFVKLVEATPAPVQATGQSSAQPPPSTTLWLSNALSPLMLLLTLALLGVIIFLLLKGRKGEGATEAQAQTPAQGQIAGMEEDGSVNFPLRVSFQQGFMRDFHVTENEITFRARRADVDPDPEPDPDP